MENGAIGAQSMVQKFNYWSSWAQWDGGHFYYLARNGYLLPMDTAFMPLFAELVHLVHYIFPNLIFAGLLVSNISFLLFLLIFKKYVGDRYGPALARDTLVTFLFFPTAFFCVAYYSEPLFLALVALCFLFIQRRQFLAASLVCAFAAVTRTIGIFLVVSVLYSYFATQKVKLSHKLIELIEVFFLASSGLLVYTLFLFEKFRDPLIFITSQGFWQRQIRDPISTIISYVYAFFVGSRPINDYFDFFVTIIFLGILIWGRRKIPSSLWIFSMLSILLPASTSTLSSMPRYALASFGTFVIVSQAFTGHSHLKYAVWAIFLIFQAVLVTLFINGYWVA